jgi:hypothetical protein
MGTGGAKTGPMNVKNAVVRGHCGYQAYNIMLEFFTAKAPQFAYCNEIA